MSPDLLSLAWQIQLSLAAGYIAYALGYSGIRAHHKAVDVAFGTLAFGLLATGLLAVFARSEWNDIWAGLSAFLATVALGLLWRRYFRDVVRWFLRITRVSQADDIPSAWTSLSERPDYDVSQVALRLEDGTWLRCDDTAKFAKSAFGPCILGGNGDILMYLTHKQSPGKETEEMPTTADEVWGDRVTYIPAARISQVNIRHKKASRRSRAGPASNG
ncbi:MAG: hypothetical protein ACTSWI_00275 [Alphaproteobacteria bacterium]